MPASIAARLSLSSSLARAQRQAVSHADHLSSRRRRVVGGRARAARRAGSSECHARRNRSLNWVWGLMATDAL